MNDTANYLQRLDSAELVVQCHVHALLKHHRYICASNIDKNVISLIYPSLAVGLSKLHVYSSFLDNVTSNMSWTN